MSGENIGLALLAALLFLLGYLLGTYAGAVIVRYIARRRNEEEAAIGQEAAYLSPTTRKELSRAD